MLKKLCQQLIPFLIQHALEKDFSLGSKKSVLRKKISGAPYLHLQQPRDHKRSEKMTAFQTNKEKSVPWVSLSHSGPYIGIALSNEGPVGIDIENKSLSRNLDKLITRLSRQDQDFIRTRRTAGFYQVWTGREALGKLMEQGLATALSLKVSAWPASIDQWSPAEVFLPSQANSQESSSPLSPKIFSLLFNEHPAFFYTIATQTPPKQTEVVSRLLNIKNNEDFS